MVTPQSLVWLASCRWRVAADPIEGGDELASDGGDESASGRKHDRDDSEWFGMEFGAEQQPNTLARIAAATAPNEGGVDAAADGMKLELDTSSDATEQGGAVSTRTPAPASMQMRQSWEALGVEPQLVSLLCQEGVPAPKMAGRVPRNFEELAHEERILQLYGPAAPKLLKEALRRLMRLGASCRRSVELRLHLCLAIRKRHPCSSLARGRGCRQWQLQWLPVRQCRLSNWRRPHG